MTAAPDGCVTPLHPVYISGMRALQDEAPKQALTASRLATGARRSQRHTIHISLLHVSFSRRHLLGHNEGPTDDCIDRLTTMYQLHDTAPRRLSRASIYNLNCCVVIGALQVRPYMQAITADNVIANITHNDQPNQRQAGTQRSNVRLALRKR